MNNWLGFSLTPHLQVGGDAPNEQGPPVASAGADAGSFSVLEDHKHYWRYENDMNGTSNNEEAPKFEDFLGGCYSNSTPPPEINMNVSPEVNRISSDIVKIENFTAPSCFYPPYNYGIVPSSVQNQIEASSVNSHGVYQTAGYGGGGGGAGSDTGFKSWLKPVQDQASGSQCDFQALPLTVTGGSQTGRAVALPLQVAAEGKKRAVAKSGGAAGKEPLPRKSIDTFGQRTSQFRGVTRHRWTGRYEAHLWDNSCRKEGQTRKGRQVYLGGYDKEEKAARAYDLAALKYWGPATHINFPLSAYENELEEMKNMNRQEFVAHLRRKSSGFSRGASMYRGVTRHHQHGRWQARIGRVAGNKDLYLGTFSTQEEAAEAYDIAAIKFRGTSAVTNFNISRYDVKRICSSSTLIGGGLAKRSQDSGHEDSNSCTPSASPRALVPLTNGELNSDELAEMMWNEDHRAANGDRENMKLGQGSSTRDLSSPRSPKGSNLMMGSTEFGNGGYFGMQGEKYDDESTSSNRIPDLELVHQVPMFALWNE